MTLADSLRHLNRAAPDPRSDSDLVAGFVGTRDEPAFAELLRRHGPTVYGVCRRILGNGPDADDAFQAVFLVLARKANTIRPPGMVGNWLYGVAVRTANKARVMAARKANRRRESPGGLDQYPAAHDAGSPDSETLAVIDAELAALPAVYRAAFVACELNGRTRREAAAELGWPEGTVAARLAKARELLAARLRKRGVTLGGLFAAVAVPPAVASETLAAVRELLAVGTANAVLPAAQQLSDEVVNTMTAFKLKLAAGVLVTAVAVLTLGAALVAGPGENPEPHPERKPMANAPVPKPAALELKDEKSIDLPSYPVQNFAISPDGKVLAAVTTNGLVSLHDPGTGAKINKNNFLQLKASATRLAVAFSPEGKLAITGVNGVVVFQSDRLLEEVASVFESWKIWEGIPDFDPHQLVWLRSAGEEGRLVATNGVAFKEVGWTKGAKANEVERYQGEEWKSRETAQHGPTVLVSAPAAGRVFYSAGAKKPKEFDLCVRVTKAQPHKIHTLAGHAARPTSGAMSADGKLLLSGDESGDLIAWDGEPFAERTRWKFGGEIAAVALAPDGRTAAVLRVTETKTGDASSTEWELYAFDATATPARPAAVWRTTVPGSYSKSDWRLPGRTGREDAGPYYASLAFHPAGSKLYGSLGEPYAKVPKDDPNWRQPVGIRVWSVNGKLNAPIPKEIPMEWKEGKPITFDPHPHGDRITGVACSPDGKFIAVAVGNQVRLLDAATRKQVNEHALTARKPASITAVAFSPNGDKLAMTAKDFVFIDSDLGKSPSASSDRSWKCEGFDPHQVAWLTGEDGQEQLIASNGRVTKQYLGKGKDVEFDEMGQHPHEPRVLAPVPGKVAWLMDCSSVKQVPEHSFWYWEPSLPEKCHLLAGHKARPVAATVAADGKRIVSADEGGTLIVWESEKLEFKEKRRIDLGERVVQLALAPDGKTVAAVRAFTDTNVFGRSGRTLLNLELHVFDVTDPPTKPTPLWSSRNVLSEAKTFSGPASLAFSPDGKTLLAAFADPYISDKDAKSMGVKVWTRGDPRR